MSLRPNGDVKIENSYTVRYLDRIYRVNIKYSKRSLSEARSNEYLRIEIVYGDTRMIYIMRQFVGRYTFSHSEEYVIVDYAISRYGERDTSCNENTCSDTYVGVYDDKEINKILDQITEVLQNGVLID